jgi:uncharacterized membrane protein (DUF106 family)
MKQVILTLIFVPAILFFAILFLLHLAVHDLNMGNDDSIALFWRNFKEIWYKSAPFYALITFIVFYIMLMISVSRKKVE